ncbi:MAG TPA: hypothetical protein VF329_08085 [Gammaproteobacteria bacterium]
MKALDYTGRGLGALAGAAVSVLWVLALWMPSPGVALTGINFVVSLLMALLGLFAVIAAVRGHGTVLLFLFAASFFPVGFALVGADHWLGWAGRLNVCYLVAGLLIRLGRRRQPGAVSS